MHRIFISVRWKLALGHWIPLSNHIRYFTVILFIIIIFSFFYTLHIYANHTIFNLALSTWYCLVKRCYQIIIMKYRTVWAYIVCIRLWASQEKKLLDDNVTFYVYFIEFQYFFSHDPYNIILLLYLSSRLYNATLRYLISS